MSSGLRELVLRPELFILAGLLYLLASTMAALDPAMQAINPRVSTSALAFLVFAFGLFSFYIGIRTGKAGLRMGYLPVIAGLALGTIGGFFILGLDIGPAVLLNVAAFVISLVLLFSRLRFEYVFAAGFLLFWLNLLLAGIPLFNPQLHIEMFSIVTPVFAMGFVFMLYSMVRLFPRYRYLWLLVIISMVMSSYRTALGIAFFTWLLLELHAMRQGKGRGKGIAKKWAWKAVVMVVGIALVSIVFVYAGHSAKIANSGSWSLDPVDTLEYRLALTMGVFDDVVGLSFPLGHTFGRSLTMEATEFTCVVLYGCTRRITSTAFGEAMLDFGLLGVFLVSWFAGVVLSNLHRHDYPLYALMFATLLATLDTGINIFIILQYIYLGWMGLMRQWTA